MVPSWDDKYSIDSSDIDLQHQKLLILLKNHLFMLIKVSPVKKFAISWLNFLSI